MTATVLGARRLTHIEYLRADEVVREIFDWSKGMASPPTLSRFFGKFDEGRVQRVMPGMFQHFWKRIPVKSLTIDILDSTHKCNLAGVH